MKTPPTPPRDPELHGFLADYFGYERLHRMRIALVHAVALTAIPFAWSAVVGLPPLVSRVTAAITLIALAAFALVAVIEAWLHRRMFRQAIDLCRGETETEPRILARSRSTTAVTGGLVETGTSPSRRTA